MFRLAHLSDIHLGPLPAMAWHQFLSKRLTGYINWHYGRAKAMGGNTLHALTNDLAAQEADHIVVSGDLTNLGLNAEVANAARWLDTLGDATTVSAVPGNHDAYRRGTLERATKAWSPWMTGERVGDAPYPFLRRIGPVGLIGCSSAVAMPPFVAAGTFGRDQAERLAALLTKARSESVFRVVVIHHPPLRGATGSRKRLYGIDRFRDALNKGGGADLVLHGHTHLPTRATLDTDHGSVPVIGVAAAGQALGGHKPPARYNLFEIERGNDDWHVTQIERGLTQNEGVSEIARHELAAPENAATI